MSGGASSLLLARFGVVWAPVFVLELVDILGLVDALVLRVRNAVVVVVEIRAAVGVLIAVGVFGLIRAFVTCVRHAVAVFVGLVRAAVFVLEAVLGLGLVRALIRDVGNAVLVVVGIRATVAIYEVVLVLGLVRALVLSVGHGIEIVVRIGAAVRIFVAISILFVRRALIGRVLDAVIVAVALLDGVGHAEDGADLRRANTLHERGAARERDRQRGVERIDLQPAVDFERVFAGGRRKTSGAEHVGDHPHDRPDAVAGGHAVPAFRTDLRGANLRCRAVRAADVGAHGKRALFAVEDQSNAGRGFRI